MTKNRAKMSGAGEFITAWISRLAPVAEIGTQEYALRVRRRLMVINVTVFLISIFSFVFAVQFMLMDEEKYFTLVIVNLALGFGVLLIPLAHRFGEIAAAIIIAVVEFAALFFFVMTLGRESGVQLNYMIAAAIPFAIFGLERLWLVGVTIISGLVLHLVTYFLFPTENALIQADPALLKNLYISSLVTTGCIIAVIVAYAFTLADRARAEADHLLENVLPVAVAERLKTDPGERIADSVSEASVMFTDLAGFTPLAQRLGAEKTLNILDEIFTEFDKIVFEQGVEKIKTIGDGYMAVCGVIEPVKDHASRMSSVALQLPGVVEKISDNHGMQLQIRIGMTIGPVMAGVIGTNKFSYDVWGETVNLASRLESHGLPGQVHVSEEVQQALRDSFHFEPRGSIKIKGIGTLETWLLKSSSST